MAAMRVGIVLTLLLPSASAWHGLAGIQKLRTARVSSLTSRIGYNLCRNVPASNPQLATSPLSSKSPRATRPVPSLSCLRLERCMSPRSHRSGRVACCADGPASPSLTERMLLTIPPEPTSGSAGGDGTLAALRKLDEAWLRMRTSTAPPPPPRRLVTEDFAAGAPSSLESFDVVVCGGNLGILLACALLARGLTVAVIEAGELRGRAQDWNASRKELLELVRLGVLTADELEDVVGIEFNPMRVGFVGGDDVWLTDVLNVGVKPQALLETVRQRFERGGGKVFERSPLASVVVHADGAVLSTAGNAPVRAKLLLDCMGQRSPIVSQLREGAAPDGVCVVVGTCARGYDEATNVFGDIIFSDVPTIAAGKADCRTQYFWEAFPASSGARDRTTYLFTYMDLEPERPSVEDIFEDYWRLLPAYQGIDLETLTLQRALFGLFVSYRASPLAAGWDRVLQARSLVRTQLKRI